MELSQRQNDYLIKCLLVLLTIITAFLCRRLVVFVEYQPIDKLLNFIRTFLYIGLYFAWAVSIKKRVIQKGAQKLLMLVALTMALWFIIREVKFRFILDENLIRNFWYLYYIPLLLIPLCALLLAISLGKAEDYTLPKWTYIFNAITFILIALVLTNDFHELVFSFPKNVTVKTEFNRSLETFYYIIIIWGILCVVGAIITMIKKCRIPGTKKYIWLPFVPFIIAILYFLALILNVPFVREYFGDFTAASTLLFAGFFESCISTGLIQSNTMYKALFEASAENSIQITDDKYNVRYSADFSENISPEAMKKAEKKSLILEDKKRLNNMKINGGHVLWIEDIKRLLELNQTLKERQDELVERNALLKYEYEKEKEHRTVAEKNRLYDLLQDRTQGQLDSINSLVKSYGETKDKEEKKKILSKIILLGSYIKRSKDFVLSKDENAFEKDDFEENKRRFESALNESFRALKNFNIKGGFLITTDKKINLKTYMKIYEFFETIVEEVLEDGNYINIRVTDVENNLRINILSDVIFDDRFSGKLGENIGVKLSGIFNTKSRDSLSELSLENDEDGTSFILDIKRGWNA
ncbi:MAG: hypothetical protein K6D02_05700 [Lachnospiraceae bacterium]|nr:hypothetical protein [Lachnospiraceae bacterium]